MKTAFFPGSFNPFTQGHADIVERALRLADKIVIGIGVNADKPDSEERADATCKAIKKIFADSRYDGKVDVVRYTGLTAEAAREAGAECLVRGVRNATDFDYEYQIAVANREIFGIDTILLPADPKVGFISSTLIRDLIKHGRHDLAQRFIDR